MDKLTDLEQKQYNQFIIDSVADGSYFRDARKWYLSRYVQPICERTILFFLTLFTGIMTYVLVMTIVSSLPIVQEVSIIIRPKDQSLYFPVIKPLRDSLTLKNIDEAVLKYLLTKYIEKRQGFDFRESNIEDLNNQMNYVKNNSSLQEYKNFQEFLSKDNAGSPIAFFGRDFQEIVNVELVEFPKKEQNSLIDKAKYFIETGVPDNANIRYSVTTKINSKIVSTEKYVAKMNFKFSGVKPSSEVVDPKLNFTITSYKIYKVK